jgi:hypothetical protein
MSFSSKRSAGLVGFVLLYVAFCISYIDRAAISIALAQIGKDFSLQASDLGIVISAFFLETTTNCPRTADRGADHVSVPSALWRNRICSEAIRLSRR